VVKVQWFTLKVEMHRNIEVLWESGAPCSDKKAESAVLGLVHSVHGGSYR